MHTYTGKNAKTFEGVSPEEAAAAERGMAAAFVILDSLHAEQMRDPSAQHAETRVFLQSFAQSLGVALVRSLGLGLAEDTIAVADSMVRAVQCTFAEGEARQERGEEFPEAEQAEMQTEMFRRLIGIQKATKRAARETVEKVRQAQESGQALSPAQALADVMASADESLAAAVAEVSQAPTRKH